MESNKDIFVVNEKRDTVNVLIAILGFAISISSSYFTHYDMFIAVMTACTGGIILGYGIANIGKELEINERIRQKKYEDF